MARRPTSPFASSRGRPPADNAHRPSKPRDRANEQLIAEAIRRQVKIGLRYRPTDAVERIVEPHVLWVTASDNACLFCLQVVSETGGTESDPKHLDPHQMTLIRLTDERFNVDPVFKRDAYENIIAIVAR